MIKARSEGNQFIAIQHTPPAYNFGPRLSNHPDRSRPAPGGSVARMDIRYSAC